MTASHWDERYRSADRLWSAGPNIFVEDRLGQLEPARGLDLAAGDGRNSIWLVDRGWKMTAVDFSGAAIARGRALSDEIEFIEADVTEWEPDDTFDLVLVSYLHLPRSLMADVVQKAIEWLKPGAELFMIGHHRSNIEHGHGGPQVAEVLWDEAEIRGWMSALRLVESSVVRRPVESEDGPAYALDALIRGRAD